MKENMELVLYTADCTGSKENCYFRNVCHIHNPEELASAIQYDHVAALYFAAYRRNEKFLSSTVGAWDCDNDHSDDPDDWVTPEYLADGDLSDISFVAVPSRSNMKEKGGKSARPRFHIFAPIEEIKDYKEYANLKKSVWRILPFLDENALDASRFFFGSEVAPKDILWHEGWLKIDDLVAMSSDAEEEMDSDYSSYGPILEGSRNKSMSLFASRVIKRYGDTEKAKEIYLEHSKRCEPPLEEEELDTIWNSAVRFFNETVTRQKDYVSPDKYNAEFDKTTLKPDDYSDIGEARVFAREFKGEVKYTSATDFLRYDGQRWREDKEMAVAAVIDFLDLQLSDAKDQKERAEESLINAGVDKSSVVAGGKALEKLCATPEMNKLYQAYIAADIYYRFVMKRRDYKYIVATQNASKPMLSMDINGLDHNAFLLNTPTATYDMAKGINGKKDHDSEDFITKMAAFSPSMEGKEIWEEALNTFFCNDQELIKYVQEIVGIAAIGKVYIEHMIIAYGVGANGKSTFWNTIYRVLGDYAGKISAEALTMNCKHNVKPEMAELKGKRLILASEMDEGMRLNTATIKQLCSTDEIQAEKKYKDPFSFVPSHTLVLYTNHLPKVGANDDGIWRRLVVIPFNARITGQNDIKNYSDYLCEKAGGYILTWILEGARTAIEKHYHITQPKVVSDAVKAYREDNDWLGHFLGECCVTGKEYSEKSGELYQSYRSYCLTNGEYVRSTTDFYSALEKAGFEKRRNKKGTTIQGLMLVVEEDFLS